MKTIDENINAITRKIIKTKKHIRISKDGKRIGRLKKLNLLENIEDNLDKYQKEKVKLRQSHIKEISKYEKLKCKWKKVDKDIKTYTMDVELDQIMTYFRLILIHLYAYFLRQYLNEVEMDYEPFVERIIHLNGTVNENNETRRVTLVANGADLKAMSALKNVVEKVNQAGIVSMNKRKYHFELV
ncbi:MAG: hypothetical protein HQK53_10265 [Oligoflexia bacterium]|nr:hypothetical protein [Oligoflexia bacterium]